MMNRIGLTACTVLLLTQVGIASDPPVKPQSKLAPAAQLVPAGTLAHIELSGRPLKQACSGMALTKIWKEEGVQELLAPALAFLKQQAGEPLEMLGSLGVDVDVLHAIAMDTRVSLSFLGVDTVSGEGGETATIPDLLFSLDYGSKGKQIADLLERLKGMAEEEGDGSWSQLELAGRSVEVFEPDGALVKLFLWRGPRRLLIGTNQTSFVKAFAASEADSLAASLAYRRAAAYAGGEGSCAFVYADVVGLMKLAKRMARDDRSISMMGRLLGEIGLETVALGVAPDAGGLRERSFLGTTQGGVLDRIYPKKAGAPRAQQMLSANTGYYGSGVISLDAVCDVALEMAKRFAPREAKDNIEEGLARVNDFLGFDPRAELLPRLDDEIGAFASWEGRALIPDLGVFFRAKDPAGVKKLLVSVLERHGQAGALRRRSFQGHELLTFDSALMFKAMRAAGRRMPREFREGPRLRPTLVIVGDYLVVTAWPQAAKNLIDGLTRGTPRLAARPDFKARWDQLGKEGLTPTHGSVYLDLAGLSSFLLDNLMPILQSAPTDMLPFDLDPSAIPLTRSITQHLFGLNGSVCRTDGGLVVEYHSPTGYLAPSFAIGVIAGVIVPMVR